jgi:hypothetical protein
MSWAHEGFAAAAVGAAKALVVLTRCAAKAGRGGAAASCIAVRRTPGLRAAPARGRCGDDGYLAGWLAYQEAMLSIIALLYGKLMRCMVELSRSPSSR